MSAAPAEPTTTPAAAKPSATPERFIVEYFPSIAWTAPGRLLGAIFQATPRWGLGHVLTLRNFVLLALAPFATLVYLACRAPFLLRRYSLTNRRVAIRVGVTRRELSSIAHDAYDALELEQGWGQAWYPAADIVFRREGREVFRLPACGYPETVRATIWKAHCAWVWLHPAEKASPSASV